MRNYINLTILFILLLFMTIQPVTAWTLPSFTTTNITATNVDTDNTTIDTSLKIPTVINTNPVNGSVYWDGSNLRIYGTSWIYSTANNSFLAGGNITFADNGNGTITISSVASTETTWTSDRNANLYNLNNVSNINGVNFTDSLNTTWTSDRNANLYNLLNITNINAVNFTDSLNEPYAYIIYTDGTTAYAKNGHTGKIDYSGTNNNTVIQSVLDGLTSGRTWKQTVKIKGYFIINTSLQINSYTILDLKEAKLFLAAASNTRMIVNDDTTNGNSNIEIIGGFLDGNRYNQVNTVDREQHPPIYIRGTYSNNIKIIGVNVTGGRAGGGLFIYGDDVIIDGNTISNCGDINNDLFISDGIYSQGKHVRITNNYITNVTDTFIVSEYSDDVIIANNFGNMSGTDGITAGNYANKVQIIDNSINNAGYTAGTFGGAYGVSIGWRSTNTFVSGNYINNSLFQGIYVNSRGNIISNNKINNSGQNGIVLYLYSNNTVKDNIINNSNTTGGYSDISSDGGNFSLISGNVVRSGYGITLNSNAINNIVKDNYLLDGSVLTDNGVNNIKNDNYGASPFDFGTTTNTSNLIAFGANDKVINISLSPPNNTCVSTAAGSASWVFTNNGTTGC